MIPPDSPVPPVSEPGDDHPAVPPVTGAGLPDFIRKQDIVTRIQVKDVTRGALLFETQQFDPTYGSVFIRPEPEIAPNTDDQAESPQDLQVLSTKSGSRKKQSSKLGPIYSYSRNFWNGMRKGQ